MSETVSSSLETVDGASAGRPVARLRPKQKSSRTSSSGPQSRTEIPFHERKWIDVEPEEYNEHSFSVAMKMNKLHRHKFPHLREKTELSPSKNFAPMFVSQFESSPYWSIRTRLNHLQRRGEVKNRFQYCMDPNYSEDLLYLRANQGHSGGNQIDPSLQDYVVLPDDFAEYIYHVGSSHDLHSTTRSELIAGARDAKRGRQTVFFTAVNSMEICKHKQTEFHLTKPRIAIHRQKMESTSKHCVLGQSESCSEEGADVLPDQIERDHPLQHSSSVLYRKSGDHGIERSII